MRRIKRSMSVMMVGFLIGSGCVGSGTGINKGDFSLISIGEEWQLGEQLSADIAKEMTVLEDPEINAFINRMGRLILSQAGSDTPVASRPWQFHVIDNKDLNAFNIPGGHVYFHSGLISEASGYHELVAVMGHEVSHGLARHGVENLSKQYGIVALASLILGNNPAAYQEILASVLAGGAVMRFSREAESESDRLGVAYMYRGGVDPMGMVSFFGKLLDARATRPSAMEQFFSSHPLTEDRIQNVKNQIQSLAPKPLTQTDPQFELFQKAVAAATAGS